MKRKNAQTSAYHWQMKVVQANVVYELSVAGQPLQAFRQPQHRSLASKTFAKGQGFETAWEVNSLQILVKAIPKDQVFEALW